MPVRRSARPRQRAAAVADPRDADQARAVAVPSSTSRSRAADRRARRRHRRGPRRSRSSSRASAPTVFLPSALDRRDARARRRSAIDLVVRADPTPTAPDAAANVVPASALDVPVRCRDTFTATGKQIEEEAAAGQVEFKNLNTASREHDPQGQRRLDRGRHQVPDRRRPSPCRGRRSSPSSSPRRRPSGSSRSKTGNGRQRPRKHDHGRSAR